MVYLQIHKHHSFTGTVLLGGAVTIYFYSSFKRLENHPLKPDTNSKRLATKHGVNL